MQALVTASPRFQVPPDQLPSIVDGAIEWYERYRDKFTAFGTFPGGGGFGVVEAADEAELNRMIIEMPFSWFSDVEVRPFVDGGEGFQQLKQAVDAMTAIA